MRVPTNGRIPNYRRQRLLLLLLEESGRGLNEMDLHKLLFLVCHEGGLGHFDFVPYRCGCYSFQAASDLRLLQKQGWIASHETSFVLRCRPPRNMAQPEREVIARIMAQHSRRRGDTLARYVYKRHPAYAIHDNRDSQLLDREGMRKVSEIDSTNKDNGTILYTIGYEGLSFDKYVNNLIHAGVTLLCDVRRNPLSRKFGFSRRVLSRVLPRIGIEYRHIPALGIDSAQRRSLETGQDYRRLFARYRRALPKNKTALVQVWELLREYGRVVLTCFEKDPHLCHRHCVSRHLAETHGVVERHL